MQQMQQQHEEREVDGIRNLKKTLKEDTFVDTNKEACVFASRELFSVLGRYMGSEASTIVKSVTGLETWRLGRSFTRTALVARIFRVQREYMFSKLAAHVSHVRLAITQWEEQWKTMMSELRQDASITDLWRMSGLLEIRPKEVKEQMKMRLDEIGENYETLRAKVVSYTTNEAEHNRGGKKEAFVPMEVDHVTGSESESEAATDVYEVRGGLVCYDCGNVRHLARDCRQTGQGTG